MRFNRMFAAALAALALVPMQSALADRPVAPASAHQRVLPLEGGQNFRDLGGYRARDGRTVKWGLLYRSGSMHNLTANDYKTLNGLGIRTVCDFRATDERKREPVNWQGQRLPAIFADDYAMDNGKIARMFSEPGLTADKARTTFAAATAEMPFTFASQYRRMFAQLLDGKAPLVFNCSAGKDRTGVAAALLLTALGVPRATVMEDYLLSNQYFDSRRTLVGDTKSDAAFRGMPPEIGKVLMGVDPAFLNAAFQAIEQRPGGLQGYFRRDLGLTPANIARLRNLYLERSPRRRYG